MARDPGERLIYFDPRLARLQDGSCMAEMFTWDFGVPDPVLLDDGSILVTFYATQLDHVIQQRYVRLGV